MRITSRSTSTVEREREREEKVRERKNAVGGNRETRKRQYKIQIKRLRKWIQDCKICTIIKIITQFIFTRIFNSSLHYHYIITLSLHYHYNHNHNFNHQNNTHQQEKFTKFYHLYIFKKQTNKQIPTPTLIFHILFTSCIPLVYTSSLLLFFSSPLFSRLTLLHLVFLPLPFLLPPPSPSLSSPYPTPPHPLYPSFNPPSPLPSLSYFLDFSR